MDRFNNFQSFKDNLDCLGQFRMELGLGRMKQAMARLFAKGFEVTSAQIVGTNGKGSTAVFLESLARQHGLKTGLYTSPHLVSMKERIRIRGRTIPDEDWLQAGNEVFSKCHGLDLTYFEVLTLMAMVIFQRQKVELAVLEAGLGGRFDATTAVDPAVNIFTPISFDHTKILGNSLEKIAWDKAGAMKKGQVVLAGQEQKVMEVLLQRAADLGASICLVKDHFQFADQAVKHRHDPLMLIRDLDLGLKGGHQLENAACAFLAWKVLAEEKGWRLDPGLCARALKEVHWPGRLHAAQEKPLLILDGAHNEQALNALKKALDQMGVKPEILVFSCLKDKDVSRLAKIVASFDARIIFVPDIHGNPRAMPKEELALIIGQKARLLSNVSQFLAGLKDNDGPVLVCGSLYLLGEIYSEFPQWLDSRADSS
ncbi:bifunctional folylpolyglutamate synthase/dihydrofolate synthase [Desulfonatronovibrio hydrogenovorans]|uniref:bifunctional folylpolyglutamate synthase/dihydrofolate synthase n=1 Tax=Desulfonatronovibrio hydrogenovorans TaxID=53245 RepID=UPI000490AECF|nr:folylpolyglutamate synthase/dihydrofolate synthase family protein [Desulfonatronovibrio hydrogenovorans]